MSLLGDTALDPRRPELVLYELKANQNLATDDDRPSLFGRPFDGPMAGHFPGQPIHYDLHVWLWERNPNGMFAFPNPNVDC